MKRNDDRALWKRGGTGLVVVAASTLGPLVGLGVLLAYSEHLAALLTAQPLGSSLGIAFLAFCIGGLGIALAVFPSFALAGWLAYVFEGHLMSLVTVALALFWGTFAGLALGHLLARLPPDHNPLELPRLRQAFSMLSRIPRNRLSLMLVCLRLSPHMPFALTNILVSQVRMPLLRATSISFVGLLPRTLLAWQVGQTLATFSDIREASRLGWSSFLATAVLAVLVFFLARGAKKQWSSAPADLPEPQSSEPS